MWVSVVDAVLLIYYLIIFIFKRVECYIGQLLLIIALVLIILIAVSDIPKEKCFI